jgi:small-conductance mechanosensitive channel
MEAIREFLMTEVGLSQSTQHKIFVSLIIFILLWLIRISLLRIVWNRTKDVKLRYEWKRSLSLIVPLIAVLIVGTVWLPAFKQFGAFLGLFSAGLAIALKDPLTNFAGWIFLLFRKPFVVGDRVQIGEHAGDVVDIRIFQFTLLEIGNWVDADQSTGRIIHIPNGKVFIMPQANYTSGFDYIWNEIPVRITFESNNQKAKSILQEIANNCAKTFSTDVESEILEASKTYLIYYKNLTPIVYTKVKDFGIQLTIRYLCNPRKRRSSEHEIWEEIITRFKQQTDIWFAYPTTRFYKSGEENSF